MQTISKADDPVSFETIAELAHDIWTEHYTPIIGSGQVAYMLDTFQSAQAIAQKSRDGMEYYLLLSAGEAAGYFAVVPKEGSLFLSKLYVSQKFRGKGLAKAAMSFIDQRKLQLRCNNITLTVNKDNTRSIAAYEKMGFLKIKPIVQDIGHGYVMDDYLMKKTDEIDS